MLSCLRASITQVTRPHGTPRTEGVTWAPTTDEGFASWPVTSATSHIQFRDKVRYDMSPQSRSSRIQAGAT